MPLFLCKMVVITVPVSCCSCDGWINKEYKEVSIIQGIFNKCLIVDELWVAVVKGRHGYWYSKAHSPYVVYFGNHCSSLAFYLLQEYIALYRIWSSLSTIIEENCIILKYCFFKMLGPRDSSVGKSACWSNMRFSTWSSSTYVKSQVWSCVPATHVLGGTETEGLLGLTGYQPKQNTSSRLNERLSQRNKMDSVRVIYLASSSGTWVEALMHTCIIYVHTRKDKYNFK